MNTVLSLENVSYIYENGEGAKALGRVSLKIDEGEFVAVLGHNGSGKSTLAKLMNALFTPTEGKVTVLGMDTSKEENVFDIRQSAGMVFQNPDNQLVATIVEEDIAFGLENLGVPPLEIHRRVAEALALVKMERYAQSAPHMLSGGQKQRIAIARAMLKDAPILVLDEPTAALDSESEREVRKALDELRNGRTTIVIAHRLQTILSADSICLIDKGRLVARGGHAELLAREPAYRALVEAQFAGEGGPQAAVS